jgi:putative ABC transport system substrate-binding protein
MDRRTFLGTLAGGLLAAPLAAEAQQARKMPRIGVIVPVEPASSTEPNVAAFRQGMRSLGYVEGQNIAVEYRYARGEAARYAEYASEFVRVAVDVMVVGSAQPTLVAKNTTQTIPIVGVGMGSDPVQSGLVGSLARPGGNVTGLSWVTGGEFAGKWVELLKEASPGILRVGYLLDTSTRPAPGMPDARTPSLAAAQAAAEAAGLTFQILEVREPREADGNLARLNKDRRGALIVIGSLPFMARANDIVNLAAKHQLPTIYALRAFMDAGGLMSYGPSLADLWGRAAVYVDKILKGARPGDLPVEQPTKFELVINLKTASALGLTIPPSLLQRADQVIE